MPLGLTPPPIGLATGSSSEILIGSGESVPPGLEAIIEFNGIYLNNRSWIDTYIVNQIGGLEDPDLRDDREVNPQQHGETAFDAFYGGRTITLTGYIRAYNIHKLRDMQQALKQALAGLKNEKELILHSWNNPSTDVKILCRKGAPIQMAEIQSVDNYFRRDFLITLRASNPRFLGIIGNSHTVQLGVVDDFIIDSSESYDKTGSAYTISGGKLVPPDTNAARWVRNDLSVDLSNTEVVIRYEPDATFTGSIVRGVARVEGLSDYIYGQVDQDGLLSIGKSEGGSVSIFDTSLVPLSRSAGNTYWLRFRVDGNALTVDHSTTDPRISESVSTKLSYTLTGTDAVDWGDGVFGEAGFHLIAGSTGWRFDDVSITPYKMSGQTIANLYNMGNFTAQPEITFIGKMSNPSLIFEEAGDLITIIGDIPAGDLIRADINERTLKNGSDENIFSQLSPFSDWPELMAGYNKILLTAEGISPSMVGGNWQMPAIGFFYNDTWL